MKEHERWAGHIVYLTITAALAAGLIAATATIFVDPTKITSDVAKYFILLAAFLAFGTLTAALFASVRLSNYLVGADQMPATQRRSMGGSITKAAGVSFFCLCLSSLFMAAFFGWVTWWAEPESTRATASNGPSQVEKALIETVKSAADAAHSAQIAALSAASTADTLHKVGGAHLKDLSDRVSALEHVPGKPADAPPLRQPLGSGEWLQIQAILGIKLDGLKGRDTCSAIRRYQRSIHADETGILSPEQIEQLLGKAPAGGIQRVDLHACPSVNSK